MEQFRPSDIFLIRYGMNDKGHAGSVVLLENGWALHIQQSDVSPPKEPLDYIPLETKKFTCETLRP